MEKLTSLNSSTNFNNLSSKKICTLTDFFIKMEEIENGGSLKGKIENIIANMAEFLGTDFIIFGEIVKIKNIDLETNKNKILYKIVQFNKRFDDSKYNEDDISYLKINIGKTNVYLVRSVIKINKRYIYLTVGTFNRPINFEQYLLFKKLKKFLSLKIGKLIERENIKNSFFIDTLTGLYNRNFLNVLIQTEIEKSKRYNYPISVIMADLDNFKKINDGHGHLVGDKILKLVGRIIKNSIRKSDIPVRYGGDEFLIFLINSNVENAYKVAKKIQEEIENLNLQIKSSSHLSVSVGITDVKREDDINSIINRSDNALYLSKKDGKSKITIDELLQ